MGLTYNQCKTFGKELIGYLFYHRKSRLKGGAINERDKEQSINNDGQIIKLEE